MSLTTGVGAVDGAGPTASFAAVVVVDLVLWNNVVVAVVPSSAYVPLNCAAAAVLLGAARWSGLSWEQLGLSRSRVRAGLARAAARSRSWPRCTRPASWCPDCTPCSPTTGRPARTWGHRRGRPRAHPARHGAVGGGGLPRGAAGGARPGPAPPLRGRRRGRRLRPLARPAQSQAGSRPTTWPTVRGSSASSWCSAAWPPRRQGCSSPGCGCAAAASSPPCCCTLATNAMGKVAAVAAHRLG